jgi:2-polyprenyl-6-hydroxyphenyl methylase/3-demethylubiquinone-9 3-methyltransferase
MLRKFRNAVVRRTDRLVRTFYYRVLYGRALPVVLSGAVDRWERARPRGDLPQAAASWDEQYSGGRWAFLASAGERARFAVIVGLLSEGVDPAVLDVGCGDGVLYQRFRAYGSSRYVGLDLSVVAVGKAAAAAGPEATFVAADAAIYQPEGRFDAIVFNEMLYYLHEPLATVRRYAEALTPGGRLIVSTWGGSPRGLAILRQLHGLFDAVDEIVVKQRSQQWTITCLKSR